MQNWNKRQELKQQGYSQAEIYTMLGGRYEHQNLAYNNHKIPGPANWCWKRKRTKTPEEIQNDRRAK